MRDLRKLRWGKEHGPAGSFSSPDQLGARLSDKNIGKTQDVTRRHKTSQDVTRRHKTVSKLQCQQTQLTALQSYKYNLPKCLSKCQLFLCVCVVHYSVGLCFKMFEAIPHVYFLLYLYKGTSYPMTNSEKMSRYDISDDRYRSQKWMSLNMFVSVPLYGFFLSSVSQRCVQYFLFS